MHIFVGYLVHNVYSLAVFFSSEHSNKNIKRIIMHVGIYT